MLLPGETKEVGVAVCTTLATINDEEFVEREVELLGEAFDVVLELSLLEGRELVEQRQNGDRVDGDHEDLETSDEEPEVVEELVTSLLDDAEETGKDWRGEDKGENVGLDHIRNEQLGSLLVETKLLLEYKRVVDRGRQG